MSRKGNISGCILWLFFISSAKLVQNYTRKKVFFSFRFLNKRRKKSLIQISIFFSLKFNFSNGNG